MGIFDDLLGPIKEIADVKNELTQSFSDVKDNLLDTQSQIKEEVDGVRESLNDAAPNLNPLDKGGEK